MQVPHEILLFVRLLAAQKKSIAAKAMLCGVGISFLSEMTS